VHLKNEQNFKLRESRAQTPQQGIIAWPRTISFVPHKGPFVFLITNNAFKSLEGIFSRTNLAEIFEIGYFSVIKKNHTNMFTDSIYEVFGFLKM